MYSLSQYGCKVEDSSLAAMVWWSWSRYHVTASLCRHVLVSWPVSLYWAPPGAGVSPHMCRATHQQPQRGGWVRKFNTIKDAAYFHGNKSREESGWWILLTEVLRPLSNTCCAAAACRPGPGRRGKAVERVQLSSVNTNMFWQQQAASTDRGNSFDVTKETPVNWSGHVTCVMRRPGLWRQELRNCVDIQYTYLHIIYTEAERKSIEWRPGHWTWFSHLCSKEEVYATVVKSSQVSTAHIQLYRWYRYLLKSG